MNETLSQLARFVVVGGLVTGTFMSLNHFLGKWFKRQTAFLLAYPPAVLLHFCLNKYWTFADQSRVSGQELGQYILLTAVAFALQWLAFRFLSAKTQWPAWLASGLATVAQMVVAYLAMKLWVFAQGGVR